MFERYTEKARRVIFFARYEASNFGSPYIETEHLLLGLLREDKTLAHNFLKSHAAVDAIRSVIAQRTPLREKTSTSVDLPLSHDSKRTLASAAEEAQRAGHKHIGTIHLLAGLLQQETCFAAEILRERGLEISTVRVELERETPEQPAKTPPPALDIPLEMQAELQRQARGRGVKMRDYLRWLVENALKARPERADDRMTQERLKETYHRLRSQMEAEGLPFMDRDELDREIARRKGREA